jgi:membrane protease YdiL (CAAX protease family)
VIVIRIFNSGLANPYCPLLALAMVFAVWLYQFTYESRLKWVLELRAVRVGIVLLLVFYLAVFAPASEKAFCRKKVYRILDTRYSMLVEAKNREARIKNRESRMSLSAPTACDYPDTNGFSLELLPWLYFVSGLHFGNGWRNLSLHPAIAWTTS